MSRLWFGRVALVCALGGFGAAADVPRIEIENVNGFEVHFVDVGRGNAFGVSFNTNFGTLSDHHHMLGRKHLLEHIMFTGSKRLPGKHTYAQTLKHAGVSWNAHTTDANTYYYAFGNAVAAEKIIDTQLSMLGGLEWKPDVFMKERDVVINEIATEINHKESHVDHVASLALLMPDGHPWRHARLGDAASLRALTIDHVKETYYRAYAPDRVRIALVGNFSDPAFAARVKAWTRASLKPADVSDDPSGYVLGSTPAPSFTVPSLVADDPAASAGGRRLRVRTELVNAGDVIFEVDRDDVDPDALELLISFLNVPVEGGLGRRLKNELGLVLSSGFGYQSFANKIQVTFAYTPSRRGLKQRAQIERLAVEAIRDARAGVDADVVARLKRATNRELARAGRTVGAFIGVYESVLKDPRTLTEQLAAYDRVTPERIAATAATLDPGRAIYFETGTDVRGGVVHPVYDRHVRIDDNRRRRAELVSVVRAPAHRRPAPVFPDVRLDDRPAGTFQSQFRQTKPDRRITGRQTLDFRRDLPDRAVEVQFELAPLDRRDVVALDLTLAAFRDRYVGELADLRDRYELKLGLDRQGYVLTIAAIGESEFVARAAEWLLSRLRDFRPSDLELELARESAIFARRRAFASAFTANLAVGDARRLVDHVSLPVAQAIGVTEALDPETVRRTWDRTVAAGDATIGMVGDFTVADYDGLAAHARAFLPHELDEAARRRNEVLRPWIPAAWIDTTTRSYKPFALPKADAYGVVRIYRGPPIGDLTESMAFAVLNSTLQSAVTEYVRGDQGLGYVHSTSGESLDDKYAYLTFYGQVDTPDKTVVTHRSWDRLLIALRDGTIDDEDITVAISKLTNELRVERLTAAHFLYSYLLGQRTRLDARVRDRMIDILATMTPEQVRAVAAKYVLDPAVPYAQTTYGDCESFWRWGPLDRRGIERLNRSFPAEV